ncbi:MAG: hypothetical protein SPM02_03035 [Bacteroidales bacterium]|nr:hypothetical protein [Bacteroidales bacterium]
MKKIWHPFMRLIDGVDGPGSGAVTETETGEPTGTTVVSEKAEGTDVVKPSYAEQDLDKKIVMIRPQDTPIDTFTREIANNEPCKSWEAGGWEIGTRETRDTVNGAVSASATAITVDNVDMWKPGDTFIVHGVSSGEDTGPMLDSNNQPVACLIKSITGSVLTVQRVGSLTAALPAIADESILCRLSPAVSELEASVEGFNIQPSDRHYYNQTHMCQVEESVIHNLMKKKVPMDFSVYKEQTLWDFKRGMELSNLFQVGGLSKNAKGELVHLSTGLWWQFEKQSTVDFSQAMTDQDWNAVCKGIFTGNNGADRRLLFAGPNLLEQLANTTIYSKQLEAKNTEIVLGLRVYKIESPFGELLVKPMNSLFQGYFSNCGMVIDPNFVKKYVMEPLQTTKLELDKTGQRRVKNAVRVHETYSLFLENLPCHRRIIPA